MYVTRMSWDQPVESGYFAITPIKSWLNWLNVWVWEKPRTKVTSGAKDYKLRVYSWTTRINWNLRVTPDDANSSVDYINSTDFYVNTWGVSMFWSPFFYRSTTDSNGDQKNIRWLSVNWPIFAWHSGNYIYMYANWTSASDNNRSYEILWENELAVGTRWWAFIYFKQRTWTYNTVVNSGPFITWVIYTWYTQLDVATDWELIHPCIPGVILNTCPSQQTQSIQVYNWHTWHGVDNPFSSHWVSIPEAYSSLMVWVNTDDPQATLDVNGSLKIGSNCVPSQLTCNELNVGTMMYLERKFSYKWSLVICIADGVTQNDNNQYVINYVWYDIMRWLTDANLSNLWFISNDYSCVLPKPNAREYPTPTTGEKYNFITDENKLFED